MTNRWNRVVAAHILQSGQAGRAVGVDREKRIIRGVIMAQAGPFKSQGRGEFDDASLQAILQLASAAPNGLKCRLAHPNESDDGIGKLLGRIRDPYPDVVGPRESCGQLKTDPVGCVRGDLHLDPSAAVAEFDMAEWLMTACESDPEAISTSLVLKTEEDYRMSNGKPMLGDDGNPLPPLWRPTELHACDVVDTGDAVDGMLSASLSADAVPNGILWKAEEMLDRHFSGKPAEFVRQHLQGYLARYLARRYGLAMGEDGNAGAVVHKCRSCGADVGSIAVTCGSCMLKPPPEADDGTPSPDATPDPPTDHDKPQGVSADRRRMEMLAQAFKLETA